MFQYSLRHLAVIVLIVAMFLMGLTSPGTLAGFLAFVGSWAVAGSLAGKLLHCSPLAGAILGAMTCLAMLIVVAWMTLTRVH